MDVKFDEAKKAMAMGNLIRAYDICLNALSEDAGNRDLQHLRVLAMARMGDTASAFKLFNVYDLANSPDPHHRALEARLLKDRALAVDQSKEKRAALLDAAKAYAKIFNESRDYYPGVNAASLYCMAGADEQVKSLAQAILEMPEIVSAKDYYAAATQAETKLLLFDLSGALNSLQLAVSLPEANHGTKSSTRSQFLHIAQSIGLSDLEISSLLEPLQVPQVAFFCGHIFRADSKIEYELKNNIIDLINKENIGFGYGALAAGSDIIIAECLLESGAELHVVLPFEKEDFIAQSVLSAGEEWLPRFNNSLSGAESVTFASEMNFVDDQAQFQYGSHVAMGLARLRATHLGSQVTQIAIWDGKESLGPAGTGADVRGWQKVDGKSLIISPNNIDRTINYPSLKTAQKYQRNIAAIIFTDFRGFSKLKEAALPKFWDGVMRIVAEVLEGSMAHIMSRNSWGDALYAVIDNVPTAARLALELQKRLAEYDYTSLGIQDAAGMRIGVHYGPVYRAEDLITGNTTFYGTEVSRAARIEPVTPPGAVFVTEPFAAILALENSSEFFCNYVGRVELAKGYGTYPMYRLNSGVG